MLILIPQTVIGKYGNEYAAAWSWLLSLITPPLSILSVAAFVDPTAAWRRAAADTFKYRSALAGTLVIAISSLGVLLAEPLVTMSSFELFSVSGIPLALLQGLVMAAVGAVVFDRR